MSDKLPEPQELRRISKRNIKRYAESVAARTTSHGTKLDPDALADRLWKKTRRCVLCSKPAYVWALYIPGKEADPVLRTGLSETQARTFAYGLCVKCYRTEGVLDRVEETIADHYLEEANLRAALEVAGISYTNGALQDGTRRLYVDGEELRGMTT